MKDFSLGLPSSELFSHRACWQAVEFSALFAVLLFKQVTELKLGFICNDLKKQVVHVGGVCCYLSCPVRS